MFQKQTQKRFFKFLEQELITVLAVAIVGVSALFSHAATVNLGVTILPAGGVVTVTAPDGGESWQLDTAQNITWTSAGGITDVMIELQRTTGGAWETIIASTDNDGVHPWVVSGAETTQATIRISKVGDGTINDTSDATFSIVSATSGGGGGGGGVYTYPAIVSSVSPLPIINNSAHVLNIYGTNFHSAISFELDTTQLQKVHRFSSTHVQATVPAGFPVGRWQLKAYNNDGSYYVWGSRLEVIHIDGVEEELPDEEPVPVDPEPTGFYSAKWLAQSHYPTLEIGESTTMWVDFQNTGTLSWYPGGNNPVRLGTSRPRDRSTRFFNNSWIKYNRAVAVSGVVQPGEVGRFTFEITAPRTLSLGNHREYFQPVVEYMTWMEDWGVYWDITVTGRPGLVTRLFNPAPTPEPVVPVVEPVPVVPTQSYLFTDSFERLFSPLTSLLGSVGDWFSGWF